MSYRDSKRPRYAEPRSRERGGITDTLSALISSNPDVLRAVQMLASALGGSGREDRDYRDRGRGSKRPREARRSVGKVTAFNDKGFGFISCGDVEPEVFVHQSETLRALHPGETVEFELIADGPGRWKAIDVVATDSSKYRPATRPSQYTGRVIDWKEQGFGFISSPSFDRDVFVHASNLVGITSLRLNDEVEFDVEVDKNNRYNAVDVRKRRSTRDVPEPTVSSKYRPATRPSQYTGRVIDWKEQGFGFISSPSFDRDVFVHAHNLVGITSLRPNDEVEFAVEMDKNNRYNALDVQRRSTRDVPEPTVSSKYRPATRPSQYTGRVIDWKEQGFGFIASPGFDRDVFVHAHNLVGITSLRSNDEVEFAVEVDENNRYNALDVRLYQKRHSTRDVPDVRDSRDMPPPAAVDGEVLGGVISTYKPTQGFGFVKCNSLGADAFVHIKSVIEPKGVESLAEGENVEFRVQVNSKGQYDAVNVVLLDRRERQTYVGVVTMYNIGKGKGKGKGGSGYGFIKCDDFGREVFMHHSELKGGGIPECGDEVQFEVELDDTHRYNAKNINIIGKGSGRISE